MSQPEVRLWSRVWYTPIPPNVIVFPDPGGDE
jgi:hypothetical protein